MAASQPSRAPPAPLKYSSISHPASGVLLVTIDRPKQLNSLTVDASSELDAVFQWFDHEPSLKVAIITGAGKSFCVGADLKGMVLPLNETSKFHPFGMDIDC